MTWTDAEAAPLYAEADRLAEQWRVDPESVADRRFAGSRHVNWRVGPDEAPSLVREPLAWQPPMITRITHREADVLRMFAGSGVTAELRHDGGRRHIQEFLPGAGPDPARPGWRDWTARAPAELAAILATVARHGPRTADGPRSAAESWDARRRTLRTAWRDAWDLREPLYTVLAVPRREFDAWLARSPAGRRWAVGVHNDVRPANLVVTPFDTKLVDLELFGDGDAAADLGKLLVCTPWPGAAGDAVAHAVQERFRDELPHAADGLREDAEGLYRGAYAADAVMGTLNQRIAGLEELLAADPSGRAAEAQLRAVAADIQGVTGPMLETFGLAPFGAERLVSSLGQWVLYDHPEAPRRRPTEAVRRDAGPGSSASPKLIAATSHGLGPVTDGVNPTPMTPRMTEALDAGPTVSPYASATDKRLDLSRGKALDRSLTNS